MTEPIEAGASPDREHPFSHRRMEYVSFIAQVVASAGIVLSLVFVGIQLNENTTVAIRNESNATMAQWSAFRTSVYADRGTAEVFRAGMDASRPLDPADQLRFDYLMREHAWATFQIWDRVRMRLVPSAHFDVGAGPDFLRVICTPGGAATWARIRSELPSAYVADLEALMPPFTAANTVSCAPQAPPEAPEVDD